MNELRGCLLTTTKEEVPLDSVRVTARISGACSEVTVAQRYRNGESKAVEAVYVFPLPADAAVSGFLAKIGDRTIAARVEERDRAFELYDDAMSAGHGAYLLDQERPNVFTASVGNLRPGDEIEIAISYVALIPREGDALRLAVPTTVSPRYVPRRPPEIGQPDGERVNPPRAGDVPYGLLIQVTVSGACRAIESPSHPIGVEICGESAAVTLASEDVALDRDFVLLVTPREPARPAARVAREADGTRVAMVTFFPQDADLPEAGRAEVLFLLDCSGSMQGDSIEQAKRALQLSIRALSEGDTFNVTCFGDRHASLWKAPRPYDARSLAEATEHVGRIDAGMGGTEILAPMKALLALARDPGRTRSVILLTDGQVANEDEVIALSAENAGHARVFAFAIGAGASDHLVRGAARASRGAAEAIYPGERIEPKVLRMFRRVTAPALPEVAVEWGSMTVDQAPAVCPPVFGGDALTVFARVSSGHSDRVLLRAGDRAWEIPIDLERAEQGGPIPTLWARETIRELEPLAGKPRGSRQADRAEASRRARIVELGKRYGLMSSETSFVAVEERSEADRVKGAAELRRIPIAVTAGWHGRGSVLGRLASGAGKAMVAAMAPAPSVRMAASGIVSEPKPAGAIRAMNRLFASRRPPQESGAPPVPPADRLFELLMTQRADGSFPLSDALIAWLGARADRVKGEVGRLGEAVVATSVVLALLDREAIDRVDEWRPAADKARRWLAAHGGPVETHVV